MPIALLAGLVTFLSPCVLPLVPGYLGYVSGAAQSKGRLVLGAILFVLGFTLVFVTLGVLAGSAGLMFIANNFWVQAVLGALVILLGLAMIGQFKFLQQTVKVPFSPKVGLAGAPLLGMVFAFGWTPCIGPILAAILAVASAQDTVTRGALLLATYSLGLGLPFIIAGMALGRFLNFVARFRKHFGKVEKLVGFMLILTGIAFLTGGIQEMSFWLLELFPNLGSLG